MNATLPLASLIYSYLRLGLPVLLLADIPGVGKHAIALTGFSIRDTQQLHSEAGAVDSILPRMAGTRIDEFYGHDDQKGPFCRLVMESAAPPKGIIKFKDTGWGVDLVPEFVIVPVYPKIRTGFREVTKYLPVISMVAGWVGAAALFEWDVFLISGNEYKRALRDDDIYYEHPLREFLLLEAFPKYLWRCILRLDGRPYLEMLLDTTAMVNGFAIRHLLWHDDSARNATGAKLQTLEPLLLTKFDPRLVRMLREASQPSS